VQTDFPVAPAILIPEAGWPAALEEYSLPGWMKTARDLRNSFCMISFGAEAIFDLQLQFFYQLLLPFDFAPLSQNQTSKRYARD
jgi:hypothetical protein